MPNGTGTVRVPSPMPVDLPPPTPPDPTGRKRVYVNPPVVHLGYGPDQLKHIRFTNHTNGTVRIWLLEAASLFVRPAKDFEKPFVVDDGDKLDLDLKPGLGYGDYVYHVYCDAIGHEADGNSPPAISCP
jgi:hypothetical protein